MGQSLPLPTGTRLRTRRGHERAASARLTMGPPSEESEDPVDADAPDRLEPLASAEGVADDAGIEAFSAAIVRNKVRPPTLRPQTLERPRLLNWLEQHSGQRVCVVSAEAGYGKTTLIADHVKRSGRRVAWIRLEAADADWVAMLSYVVASFREVIPDYGVGAVNLLQRVGVLNATRDMALDIILAELERTVTDPLTLVLDDFHAVQEGDDVRAIVSRLIELAPSTVRFIISGRRHPGSFILRPSSHGQVVELGTKELRFTRTEAGHLFANILGSPLDEDLVAILDDRLAGWGASLQLVGTSLVGLRPASVRVFIEELTSRSEPLYDYLAEHVLGRQPASMRRVLSVASILERIEPTLVLAAMTGEANVSSRRIATALGQAEEAGVINRNSSGGRWWRLHPLVRDFMLSRLLENTNRPALLRMHRRVAEAAEHVDWAVAAHHYIEAELPEDAMRVLRESAIEALGTATWGEATALADRMPDQPVPEAVSVVRAYNFAASGHVRRALGLLESLDPSREDPVAWGLTKIALAGVRLMLGQLDDVRAVVSELNSFAGLPPVIASVAAGFQVIVVTYDGGGLGDASAVLEDLAREHARLGLHHYAAVSYHNAAVVAFARGRYDTSVSLAKVAIEHFKKTQSRFGIESSHAMVAQGLWELGQTQRARDFLGEVGEGDLVPPDAWTDAAFIAAASGETDRAWVLIGQAARALDANSVPSAVAGAQYAKALAHLVDGNHEAASRSLLGALEHSVELDALERHAAISALVELVSGDRSEAMRLAVDGQAAAVRHGASHWVQWFQLLSSVADSNPADFRRSLVSLATTARLSTLALADAIAMGFAMCPELPPVFLEVIRGWPKRWLPVLRRVVQGSERQAGLVAAELLATHGTLQDVAVLTAFERRHIRQPGRRVFSRRLARHANPTMVVHDLGRLRLQLGQRVIPLAQSRRKAASLVAYLASRPSHAAARDQVLDAIWPNQVPTGAANSLHQTLFFLRRDIDPWYEDGHSVDYLVIEPDVVYLDPDLVQVDSAAFFRQASAALVSDSVADVALPILRDYPARFALDFEYEEWSLGWRDQLHALFLETTEATADALVAEGRFKPAIDVLERAIAIDGTSLDLEATLIRALHRSGAVAAAVHQYRHYSNAHREEHGAEAPALDILLGG